MGLLRALKLWVPEAGVAEEAPYGELCHAGALVGGLSLALDLRPDELIGPLAKLLGGSAAGLKVLDVRDVPVRTLTVLVQGKTLTWEVQDCAALLEAANVTFENDWQVKAAVLLGTVEEALQVWCVPKGTLPLLLADPRFQPLNAGRLRRLVSRLQGGDDADG